MLVPSHLRAHFFQLFVLLFSLAEWRYYDVLLRVRKIKWDRVYKDLSRGLSVE